MKLTNNELWAVKSALDSKIREDKRYIKIINELYIDDNVKLENTKKPFIDDINLAEELINKIDIELNL